MNQISDALRASIAKREAAFTQRVNIALIHLPRVLSEMNDGVVIAASRQAAIDHLIRDGVLGARHNARRIAHAKKHGIPLDSWSAETANKIVNRALAIAETNGYIVLIGSDRTSFEVHLTKPYSDDTVTAATLESLDTDELYTLRENVPRHLAREWELHNAHE